MAKHETLTRQSITAAILRTRMESRLAYLYDQDKYNGQYAGEFGFIESVLADSFTEEEDSKEGEQFVENFATSTAEEGIEFGGGVGASRPGAGLVGGNKRSPIGRNTNKASVPA